MDSSLSSGDASHTDEVESLRWLPKLSQHQLDSSRDRRRQQALDLLDQFVKQIRVGCQDPRCPAPTCLNYQRRHLGGAPLRRPTLAAATTLAEQVMATDNPLARLCPSVRMAGPGSADRADVGSITGEDPPRAPGTASRKDEAAPMRLVPRDIFRPGEKRDTKSLSQVLLNTQTWRYADSIEVSRGAYRFIPNLLDRVVGSRIGRGATQTWDDPNLGEQYRTKSSGSASKRVRPPGLNAVAASEDADVDEARLQQLKTILPWGYLETVLPKLERYSCDKPARQQCHQTFERTAPFAPYDSAVGWPPPKETSDFETALMRVVLYVLGIPDLLRGSFLEKEPNKTDWHSYQTMGIKKMCTAFLIFYANDEHPQSILPSLWRSLGDAYHRSAVPQHQRGDAYTEHEAAHLLNIGLGALLACVFVGDASVEPSAWATFTTLRAWGRFLPTELTKDVKVRRQVVEYVSTFENEMAVRLMKRILRAFASHSFQTYRKQVSPWETAPSGPFIERVLRFIASDSDRSRAYGRMVLEWARTVFQKEWDGEAEFAWSGDAGCAIEFMRVLHDHRARLQLDDADFAMPFLFKRLDFLEVPVRWLQRTPPPAPDRGHVLDYPWLFPAAAVVTYFRAINYAAMFDAFARSIALSTMTMRLSMLADRALLERLAAASTSYLVLEIRRGRILEDALDRLWRRRARELRRPLKIRMGIREGEEGVDLGGVQQEFFRLALGQALDPAHGLFTVDAVTRMAYFAPAAAAPLYQFVLVGLLVGLAVYNGITLPVTFPLALYRKLLGWPVRSLEHIEDGWPVLAKGLRSLAEWSEGDVADVFLRSYAFSGESNGEPFEIDMCKHRREDPWPSPASSTAAEKAPGRHDSTEGTASRSGSDTAINTPGSSHSGASPLPNRTLAEWECDGYETPLVTNANRHAYIDDYIFYLTDKTVRAQYDAFATGFFLPLDRPALRLFTPAALRDLVEGFQDIDVDGLERVAKYENGFGRAHPLIVDFWRVVRGFSPAELRSLLEFVTASDRVPVKGVDEMLFLVQRNGSDDARLPTSMTCFGRLLLPEYSSRARLEEKLRAAIENSRGFGVA